MSQKYVRGHQRVVCAPFNESGSRVDRFHKLDELGATEQQCLAVDKAVAHDKAFFQDHPKAGYLVREPFPDEFSYFDSEPQYVFCSIVEMPGGAIRIRQPIRDQEHLCQVLETLVTLSQ